MRRGAVWTVSEMACFLWQRRHRQCFRRRLLCGEGDMASSSTLAAVAPMGDVPGTMQHEFQQSLSRYGGASDSVQRQSGLSCCMQRRVRTVPNCAADRGDLRFSSWLGCRRARFCATTWLSSRNAWLDSGHMFCVSLRPFAEFHALYVKGDSRILRSISSCSRRHSVGRRRSVHSRCFGFFPEFHRISQTFVRCASFAGEDF